MKKLDFMIVGYPRCGTSFLYYLLSTHKDLFIGSVVKETNFFNDEEWSKLRFGDVSNESDFFTKFYPKNLDGKLLFEATPTNYKHERALQYCKQNNTKAIFVIRSHFDRLRSTYMHWKEFKFIGDISYDDFIDQIINKKFNNEYFDNYLEDSNYARRIMEWRDQINKKNVLVIFFEDMIKSPKKTLEQISTFLDVDPPLYEQKLDRIKSFTPNIIYMFFYHLFKNNTLIKSIYYNFLIKIPFFYFIKNINFSQKGKGYPESLSMNEKHYLYLKQLFCKYDFALKKLLKK